LIPKLFPIKGSAVIMDFYSTLPNAGLFLLRFLLNIFKWFLNNILLVASGTTLGLIIVIRRWEYMLKILHPVTFIFSKRAPLGKIGFYGNQIRNYGKGLGDKLWQLI